MTKKIIIAVRIINKLKLYFNSLANFLHHYRIIIISSSGNWVIQNITSALISNLKNISRSSSPLFLKNKIIHFSNIHAFISHHHQIHPSNKIIITWYHLNDRPIEKDTAHQIASKDIIIHTACQKTKQDLISLGIPPKKIIVIPLGIDLKIFRSPTAMEKITAKKRLNFPLNKIIIGSFQKDGNGWNDGLEPKLIKGPDIFCDTMEILAKKYPIHILLTGPARGYIKNRLTASGIPFTHRYLKNYNNIASFYHALDLYLIASRLEGGPMAILESWATGTPLVATPVGMIPDIGQNRQNLLVSSSFSPTELAVLASEVINNPILAQNLSQNGLKKVTDYLWNNLTPRYWRKLYLPLLSQKLPH